MSTQSTVLHTRNKRNGPNTSPRLALSHSHYYYILFFFFTKTIFFMPFASLGFAFVLSALTVRLDSVAFSLSRYSATRSVNETDRNVWYAAVSARAFRIHTNVFIHTEWIRLASSSPFGPLPSSSLARFFLSLFYTSHCCCPCRTNTLMQTQTIRYCVCCASKWVSESIVCPHCTQHSTTICAYENEMYFRCGIIFTLLYLPKWTAD